MLRNLLNYVSGWFKPESRGMVVQECEERILYSADLHPALWGAGHAVAEVRMLDEPHTEPYSPWGLSQSQSEPKEIVFIDDKVANAEPLIEAVRAARGGQAHLEIVRIDSRSSGLQQISDALKGQQDLRAIHIISHGSSGNLALGQGSVDSATLYHQRELLNSWRGAFSDQADILLYGCDVGAGAIGRMALTLAF